MRNKKMGSKKLIATGLVMMALLTGCGENNTNAAPGQTNAGTATDLPESSQADIGQADISQADASQTDASQTDTDQTNMIQEDTGEEATELPNIYLRLGETEDRPSYEIALEDNEVSVRFVRILRDMTRVIPLYVFDGSENTDVLQYYDIPSSYDIPDGEPEMVTSEKAGEVYYSAGRIMIFYKDAEIEGNYVKIGKTLTTQGLEDAVNSNPLDYWGNKRVTIGIME